MGKKAALLYGIIIISAAIFCGCLGQKGDVAKQEPMKNVQEEAAVQQQEDGTPAFLLKIATTKIPGSDAYRGLELFQERVESASNDTIEVQLYPSGQLGEQAVIMEGIHIGTVEMAFLPVDAVENIFPEITALCPLFSVESEEQALSLLAMGVSQEILEEMRVSENIRSMGFSVGGLKNIWTKQQLDEISDFNGLRLRIPESAQYSNTFRSLNISATSIPLTQVFDAMKAKLLDGVELDLESVLRYKMYEQSKYCLETGHAITINTFFISEDVYQKMTAEHQQIVCSAAEEVSEWLIEQYWENKDMIQSELEEKGVHFYELDAAMKRELERCLNSIEIKKLEEY